MCTEAVQQATRAHRVRGILQLACVAEAFQVQRVLQLACDKRNMLMISDRQQYDTW